MRHQEDADLLAKMRRNDLFAWGAGRWTVFPSTDFHETKNRRLWDGQERGWPLWKGESFGQFDPQGAGERRCPATEAALAIARGKTPGAASVIASATAVAARREAVSREVGGERVAFSDVTQRSNSRTVIACLIPPQTFLVNSAPYLVFVEGREEARGRCAWGSSTACPSIGKPAASPRST